MELASSVAERGSDVKIDARTSRVITDYALKEETGHTGFPGYMLYRAKIGISIGKFYSENRLQLTGLLAWLYWAAELGLVLYIVKGGVKDYAKAPYCEACGKRLGRERAFGRHGPCQRAAASRTAGMPRPGRPGRAAGKGRRPAERGALYAQMRFMRGEQLVRHSAAGIPGPERRGAIGCLESHPAAAGGGAVPAAAAL